MEDTARKAIALLRNEEVKDFVAFDKSQEEINEIVENEIKNLAPNQKFLRGLYTGGTLADEAMEILSRDMGSLFITNHSLKPEYQLKDVNTSVEHTCIDFGEDEFTVGRPPSNDRSFN